MSDLITQAADLNHVIACAAEDPNLWTEALSLIAKHLSSESVSFHWEEMSNQHRASRFALQSGLSQSAVSEFEAYYGARNPVIEHAQSFMIPGHAQPINHILPESAILNSEFYVDYLRRHDIRYVLGGTIAVESNDFCLVSICRSRAHGPFSNDETNLLRFILPSLRTALLLQRRLQIANDRLLSLEQALNHFPEGIILLSNESAQVLFLNEVARRLVASRSGIILQSDSLQFTNPRQQRRLLQTLRSFALSRKLHAPHLPQSQVFQIRRRMEDPAWLLQLFAISSPNQQSAPLAAVLAQPSTQSGQTNNHLLTGLDLSPMQSRIAQLITLGKTQQDISDELNITRNTVKTHINRIFSKLNISRQSELVRLISQIKHNP